MRGQPARRVRRAGTGRPTAETLHGVPSPTQQIQALDRTAPTLPMRPGLPERRTHDYIRHGTTTLFAALDIATGTRRPARCQPRHRHQEFLRVPQAGGPRLPRPRSCIWSWTTTPPTSASRSATGWRANPRVQVHFTPTSASWLNLVEVWFGIIERQAIHRGSFGSVTDLNRRYPRLHRRLERTLPPVRLDQNRRPDPGQSRPEEDFRRGPLVSRKRGSLTGAAVVEEVVGGLGPDEGVAAFVPAVDERADRGDQVFDAAEAAAADGLAGDDRRRRPRPGSATTRRSG